MRSTRLLCILVLVTTACGARYHKETIGHGSAHLHPAGPDHQALVGIPVASSPDPHQVRLRIELPRAVELSYQIACPGRTERGEVGETREAYRARRLREIAARRERQKRTAGAVGEAVLGTASAAAGVRTPEAEADVSAEVEGRAVGEAAADSALPEPRLPPGDTGARTETRALSFRPTGGGQCTLAVWSEHDGQDVSGVTARLEIDHMVDLQRRRAAQTRRAELAAREVRGTLRTDLVARGADPDLRERQRLAARAERRAKKHARRAAERERRRARLEAERERRHAALDARGRVQAHLVAHGADPQLRARLRAEARARQQAETRARLRAGRRERRRRAQHRAGAEAVRDRMHDRLIAHGADPDHRRRMHERQLASFEARAEAERRARRRTERRARQRMHAALQVRASIKSDLLARGAVDRPPRPAPPDRPRPPAPDPTAVWVDGHHEWNGRWVWRTGYWTQPPTDTVVWLPEAEIIIDGTTVIRPGGWFESDSGDRVRDHRDDRTDQRRTRDHR